jgi:NAD(P)-dependent dehydrogenase (short-subunit alcohol dehydrogenase family)
VADYVKTVAQEYPDVLCKIVDLDPSDPPAILHYKLADELSATDTTLEAGLPGDRRLTVALKLASLDGEPARRISGDWVFLLTGGARGITAEIARLLAERHHPTLILAGASALPPAEEPADVAGLSDPARLKAALRTRLAAKGGAVKPADVEAHYNRCLRDREIRGNLEMLRRLGASVAYHQVDVRDEAGFGALIESIYKSHGRLDVVIHGAGIIEDKLIAQKRPDSFERVFHTKADSAFLLSRKLRFDSLQCLVFMSSIAAVFGNRGQGDYGAANGAMNGLAALLCAKWPGRVAAISWGPWDQVGMASEGVRQQLLARGIRPIPASAGAEAALREIETGATGQPVVVIGAGPWDRLAVEAGAREELAASAGRGGM